MIGLSRVKLDLADLQGGMLEPYRLPNGEYLFLRVDDADRARTWLRATVDQVTTSLPLNGVRRETTLNIAFTYPGLEALGLPAETLSSFVPEFREGMAPEERYAAYRQEFGSPVAERAPEMQPQ